SRAKACHPDSPCFEVAVDIRPIDRNCLPNTGDSAQPNRIHRVAARPQGGRAATAPPGCGQQDQRVPEPLSVSIWPALTCQTAWPIQTLKSHQMPDAPE